MHCHAGELPDRVISRQVWSKVGLHSLSNLVSNRHRLKPSPWNTVQWTLFTYLEDLDPADDLAVISPTRTNLQEKSDRLSNYAKPTGLRINQKKSQVMCIDVPAVPPITIDGEALDYVEDFTHLESLISCDNGTEKDVSPT